MMKQLFILMLLMSGISIGQTVYAQSLETTNQDNEKQQILVNVVATNSTSVPVNVQIQNQVTSAVYSFVVPANASGSVITQIPQSDDYYKINMSSSTAVRMRFYWADSGGPTTSFSAQDVPLAGCESCPSIYIE